MKKGGKRGSGKSEVKAGSNKEIPQGNILQLFHQYSNDQEVMDDAGIFTFFVDQLKMAENDELVGYLLVSVMGVKKIDEVTIDNFTNLFTYTKAKNVVEIRQKLDNLRNEYKNPEVFRQMYRGIFDLYIGKHTTLDLDVAEQLWKVYLPKNFRYHKEFESYLQKIEEKETKKVHKDLWNMMLEFCFEIKDVNKDYSEIDGWPVFIDGFVNYIKEGGK